MPKHVRAGGREGRTAETPGKLYVVGTPIGNLGDLTLRAIETLGRVSCVAAEDTRRARALLSHLNIVGKQLLRLDSHAPDQNLAKVLADLESGAEVALVTDAGMPSISDPGALLVQAVTARGLEVHVLPGPSAVTAAAAASGLVEGPFWFVGFLPRKGGERRALLARIAVAPEPVVLFENPGRTHATLSELAASNGERPACVCRELTKLHEETVRGPLAVLAERSEWRGEVTIVLGRAGTSPVERAHPEAVDELIRDRIQRGDSTRDIAREIALETGLGRREVYERTRALRACR